MQERIDKDTTIATLRDKNVEQDIEIQEHESEVIAYEQTVATMQEDVEELRGSFGAKSIARLELQVGELKTEVERLRGQLEYHHTTCPGNLAAGLKGMQERDTTIATLREECDVWKEQYERQWGRMNDAIAKLRGELGEDKLIAVDRAKVLVDQGATNATLLETIRVIEHDKGSLHNRCCWCNEVYPDHRDDCMRQKALATEAKSVHQE